MMAFINLSAYRFTPLDDLAALRSQLLAVAKAAALRGTILLSTEGVNLCVAGTRDGLDRLVGELRAVPGLADLAPKESTSAEQPFNRMQVKIKREIIPFGVAGVDPARRPAKRLPASTLRQWLDEGRPLRLLDTRNDYEIRVGTFRGAVPAGIAHFRDFPAASRRLPAEWKEQPVVTFCTGGIRCEKAAPFLESVGFKHVYQLDGGILKYFETCGGAHFAGACFVFDQRGGVDPALRETAAARVAPCAEAGQA